MLIDLTKKINGIIYSEVTKELTIQYSDGLLEKYTDVPKSVYENIVNNGKVLNETFKKNLDESYKKTTLL